MSVRSMIYTSSLKCHYGFRLHTMQRFFNGQNMNANTIVPSMMSWIPIEPQRTIQDLTMNIFFAIPLS